MKHNSYKTLFYKYRYFIVKLTKKHSSLYIQKRYNLTNSFVNHWKNSYNLKKITRSIIPHGVVIEGLLEKFYSKRELKSLF